MVNWAAFAEVTPILDWHVPDRLIALEALQY